jgi:hypothetical protein
VTPREVKGAIDRNDENGFCPDSRDWMRYAKRIRAFITVHRKRARNGALLQPRLTVETTRVLVDASNVARYELDLATKAS